MTILKRLIAPVLFVFLVSCGKKDSGGCQPASIDSEKNSMIAYCTANNINYTQNSSGILYEILSPGSGSTLTANSKIYITYTGKLLNGSVFDSQSDATQTGWPLSSLIEGWQIGVPLIKKGGHIKMVIPSSLCYGCNGSGPIPSNAPLFFDITLVDVQ